MIDEKKLIEILKEWADSVLPLESDIVTDVIGVVEEQPQIGEWMPCSERLPSFGPEKQRSVLVTMEDSDGMRFVTSAKYQEERCEWCNFKDPRYYNFEVIAWQPLPEPWEGEK